VDAYFRFNPSIGAVIWEMDMLNNLITIPILMKNLPKMVSTEVRVA